MIYDGFCYVYEIDLKIVTENYISRLVLKFNG